MSVIKQLIENYTAVQASAGSGKTYLLTSRIVRLLLQGVPAARILAITFTRKAANEMQTRLLQRLLQLSTCDNSKLDDLLAEYQLPLSEELRHRARHLYESILRSPYPVKTTTFHAFCQELLRRFPLEADVPPGFDLLDTTGVLLEQAWEALMVEASDEQQRLSHALRRLFDELGLHNSRLCLSRFVEHRSDWWAYTWQQDHPAEYATHKLADELGIDAGAEDPRTGFIQDQRTSQQLEEFNRLLGMHPTKTNLACITDIQKALADEQLPLQQRFSLIQQGFLTQKGEPRSREISKTIISKMGQQGAERYVELHQQLSSAIMHTLDRLAGIRCLDITSCWYVAGEHYLKHYQRIKLEQRQLDFNDLEWKTWLLLNQGNNALWVQFKLDERIDHFLFDEFQDTNPTQWRLLLPLLEELAASDAQRQRSVFLVGDIKQSIYRFRRAEPRLFETATEWMQQKLSAVTLPLSDSWRSSPAIIDFVNCLFSTGELHRRLQHFETHGTHLQQLSGSVSLLPLVSEPDNEDETVATEGLRNPLLTQRQVAVTQRFYLEGRAIAEKIRELIDSKTVVGHGEQARLIDYNDIMILVRQRSHVADYEKALREYHVPYLGAERGTLLESPEVRDMMTLLQWLISPFDNLALARILRSPLFAVSDEDLLTLYRQGKGNWFERLQLLTQQDDCPEILQHASRQLSDWKALADHIPVHDLLDRIYCEANLLARYAAATADNHVHRTLSNLSRFLELALDMDSGRYPSLSRFSDWLNTLSQQEQEAPDEPVAQTHENRVQILTIHAAKGLEAPVVFLADSNSTPANKQAYTPLVEWPAEQPRPDYFQLILRSDDLDRQTRTRLQHQDEQIKREDANLLYVAVTRARQHLYISGTQSERKNASWYQLIAEQYAMSASQLEAPALLQQYGEPDEVIATNHTPADTVIEFDSRLSQPFNITPVIQDIAPSHTGTPASFSGESDSDYQTRGLVIHWIMEHITGASPVDENQLYPANPFPCDSKLFAECLAECRQVIAHPQLKQFYDPQQYQRAINEVPVYYYQGERMVHGIIDRLLIRDSHITIIDYKSHSYVDAGNIEELATHYRSQMEYYTEGAARIWPQHSIEKVLIFTQACLAAYV